MDGEKRSSDVRGMSMEQWRMLVCDTSWMVRICECMNGDVASMGGSTASGLINWSGQMQERDGSIVILNGETSSAVSPLFGNH